MFAYIKEAFFEIRNKVSWPSYQDIYSKTIVIVLSILIISIILFFIDSLLRKAVNIVYIFISRIF